MRSKYIEDDNIPWNDIPVIGAYLGCVGEDTGHCSLPSVVGENGKAYFDQLADQLTLNSWLIERCNYDDEHHSSPKSQ